MFTLIIFFLIGIVAGVFLISIRSMKIKAFCLLICILSVTLCCIRIVGLMPEYSEGSRIGYVTKISKKGLFVKSYEGFARASNLGSTSSTGENGFLFSLDDKELTDGIMKCAPGKVQLDYKQYLIKPLRFDTAYIINSFKCL